MGRGSDRYVMCDGRRNETVQFAWNEERKKEGRKEGGPYIYSTSTHPSKSPSPSTSTSPIQHHNKQEKLTSPFFAKTHSPSTPSSPASAPRSPSSC